MKIVSKYITKSGVVIVMFQRDKTRFYSTFLHPNSKLTEVVDACWEITGKTYNPVRQIKPLRWTTYASARKKYNEMIQTEPKVKFNIL